MMEIVGDHDRTVREQVGRREGKSRKSESSERAERGRVIRKRVEEEVREAPRGARSSNQLGEREKCRE